jgi:hypothetical protein
MHDVRNAQMSSSGRCAPQEGVCGLARQMNLTCREFGAHAFLLGTFLVAWTRKVRNELIYKNTTRT